MSWLPRARAVVFFPIAVVLLMLLVVVVEIGGPLVARGLLATKERVLP